MEFSSETWYNHSKSKISFLQPDGNAAAHKREACHVLFQTPPDYAGADHSSGLFSFDSGRDASADASLRHLRPRRRDVSGRAVHRLSLIQISGPTRQAEI